MSESVSDLVVIKFYSPFPFQFHRSYTKGLLVILNVVSYTIPNNNKFILTEQYSPAGRPLGRAVLQEIQQTDILQRTEYNRLHLECKLHGRLASEGVGLRGQTRRDQGRGISVPREAGGVPAEKISKYKHPHERAGASK